MAFPPAGFPGLGPTPGSTALDQPPPSPTPMGGSTPSGPFSMSGLASQIPGSQMSPDVMTGVTSALTSVSGVLDSVANVMPDQASQLAMVKDLLQQIMANAMQKGGGSLSPTNAGPAPPMGGMDRGLAGAGSI